MHTEKNKAFNRAVSVPGCCFGVLDIRQKELRKTKKLFIWRPVHFYSIFVFDPNPPEIISDNMGEKT